MKKIWCLMLVATLIAPSTTWAAGDGERRTVPGSGLQASIARAVASNATQAAGLPATPRRRTGPDRSLKQMGGGGSKMGMILGIVGSLAGIGMTVYMVKAMKNDNDKATEGQ